MTNTEWAQAAITIGERWPRWKPTKVERDDWKQALSEYAPDWLEDALHRVKVKYTSDEPRIKWVLDALAELKRERRAVADAAAEQCQHAEGAVSPQAAVRHLSRFSPGIRKWLRDYSITFTPDANPEDSLDPAEWSDELVSQAYRQATTMCLTHDTMMFSEHEALAAAQE